MTRVDFQQLADVRIEEAGVLVNACKPDGAYYLAGYAVECALKACVAKLTHLYDYPDKAFATKCFTHDLLVLVKLANLEADYSSDIQSDAALNLNWQVVKDWSEQSRYQRKTLVQAQDLYNAITDADHGVLPWIKTRW
ncbi:MAG: hypothetical protein U0746_10845 [Gemmataceae bacterium]